MNNSISPKEFYSNLMAVCTIILALAIKVLGDDPIIDTILIFVIVVLILNFAIKTAKAKRWASRAEISCGVAGGANSKRKNG